jgi:hypothetical protein
MPTVTGRITVRLTGCPALPRAAGCVYRKRPRTIYLRRGLRRPGSVLLHELGHLFDLRVMNNGDRRRFRKVLGASKRRWWAVAEQFAESYSFCARWPIGTAETRMFRRGSARARSSARGPARARRSRGA